MTTDELLARLQAKGYKVRLEAYADPRDYAAIASGGFISDQCAGFKPTPAEALSATLAMVLAAEEQLRLERGH